MIPVNETSGNQSHPTEEELIAYRSAGLGVDRRKTVQGHLSKCDSCREIVNDINDFFEPARETEKTIGEKQIDREWESLLRRIRAEERLAAPALTGKQFSLPAFRLWPNYAVIAVLACVTLLLGSSVLWLQRENRRLSREMQSQREERTERLRMSEIENQWLREEAGRQKNDDDNLRRLRDDYEARLSQLKKPLLNSPIFDIYSRQFIRRAAGDHEVNRIGIPVHADSFILIVNGENQPQAPSYEVEILTDKGLSIWRKKGLRREDEGNFVIMVPRTFLSTGDYSLKIHSRDGSRSKSVVEYLISITI